MILCLFCQKNPAIKHPAYGYLPCKDCGKGKRLTMPTEFAPQSLKESRKEFAKDIIQSSRDGVLSKERLETYGTKGLKVTQEQIDNAQYVWSGEIDAMPYKSGPPKII